MGRAIVWGLVVVLATIVIYIGGVLFLFGLVPINVVSNEEGTLLLLVGLGDFLLVGGTLAADTCRKHLKTLLRPSLARVSDLSLVVPVILLALTAVGYVIKPAGGMHLKAQYAFSRRVFHQADLEGACLRGATLRRSDLQGANLSGADLSVVDLEEGSLKSAKLISANMQHAMLYAVDLSWADLAGADLSGAYLNRATLIRADLTAANLVGAILDGADLTGARVTSEQLYGASLRGTTLPDGTVHQ